MKLPPIAFTLVAALVASSSATLHAGVTGNSYDVSSVAITDGQFQVFEGCARFEMDSQLDMILISEQSTLTFGISPYGEVDFGLFGFWSVPGPSGRRGKGGRQASSGIQLFFGSLIFGTVSGFPIVGTLGDCQTPGASAAAPVRERGLEDVAPLKRSGPKLRRRSAALKPENAREQRRLALMVAHPRRPS